LINHKRAIFLILISLRRT